MTYPVLLHVEGRRAVIVGGGHVAARKASALLEAGAQVTIVSPDLDAELSALADAGRVEWHEREYERGLLKPLSPFIVFAATGSPEVNAEVVADAHTLNMLVDSVDGAVGDFTSMAVVRRGPLTLAVGTAGASPALTVHLKQRLESAFGGEYGTLAAWLAALRPFIQARIAAESERRRLWQAVIESPALEHLRRGDETSARAVIASLLADAGVEDVVW